MPDVVQGAPVVLLVEDEAALMALFGQGLQQAGFHVILAQTAAEAIRRARNLGRIDILATDLFLTDHLRRTTETLQRPPRHGLALMRRMLELHPDLKVVLFSGQSDDTIEEMGGIPPGTVFLRKPFSPEMLARTIRQFLEGRGRSKTLQIKTESKPESKPRIWKLP